MTPMSQRKKKRAFCRTYLLSIGKATWPQESGLQCRIPLDDFRPYCIIALQCPMTQSTSERQMDQIHGFQEEKKPAKLRLQIHCQIFQQAHCAPVLFVPTAASMSGYQFPFCGVRTRVHRRAGVLFFFFNESD